MADSKFRHARKEEKKDARKTNTERNGDATSATAGPKANSREIGCNYLSKRRRPIRKEQSVGDLPSASSDVHGSRRERSDKEGERERSNCFLLVRPSRSARYFTFVNYSNAIYVRASRAAHANPSTDKCHTDDKQRQRNEEREREREGGKGRSFLKDRRSLERDLTSILRPRDKIRLAFRVSL